MKRFGRRRWLAASLAATAFLGCTCLAATTYYDTVELPGQQVLKQATTIYYSDGTTVMARLGAKTRYVIDTSTLPAQVTGAVLSAEDRHFRQGAPFHFPSVLAQK